LVTDKNVIYYGSSDATSSSLLQRVRAQDRAAWERLVSLYGPLVYRWCRQAGLESLDAEDTGQEVFAAVFRKVADFRRQGKGSTFRGWLRVIARNKVCDHLRRQQTVEPPAIGGTDPQNRLLQIAANDDDESEPMSDPTEASLLARRALELLRGEFKDEKWQAFYRVVVEGQTPAEVAAALKMSVNSVYLAKSRGLRRLREEFGELLEVTER
jgi:RNA polymerase sigma-70 factor, ECF subfamily